MYPAFSSSGFRRHAILAAAALSVVLAQPARSQTSADDSSHPALAHERTFLTIDAPEGDYRLETVIVRPAAAAGRLPIALLTHGKPRNTAEMARLGSANMVREARDMAYRGYLAVAVVRRGYGQSGGTPGVATNAPYAQCNPDALQKYFEVEADDLAGALKAVASRPDADGNRAIVIGGSVGGGVALALAARNPPGLIAAINISGGVRLTNAQAQVICPYDNLAAAFAILGARTRMPTLWIYAQNDSLFAPETAQMLHASYLRAGGKATFKQIPALQNDGHHAMETHDGRQHWLAAFDIFARTNNLPTWNAALLDEALQRANVSSHHRGYIGNYLSLYTPKVLVQSANGRLSYTADTRNIFAARQQALESCQKTYGAPCRVVMENFSPLQN